MRLDLGFIHYHRATFHHPAHFVSRHVDVRQRIAFDGNQVGKVARRYGPEFFLLAQ
jgi:hypothetical protein